MINDFEGEPARPTIVIIDGKQCTSETLIYDVQRLLETRLRSRFLDDAALMIAEQLIQQEQEKYMANGFPPEQLPNFIIRVSSMDPTRIILIPRFRFRGVIGVDPTAEYPCETCKRQSRTCQGCMGYQPVGGKD